MAWEWLSIISSLPEIITGLSKKSRTNNVTKKLLLSELKNNPKFVIRLNANDNSIKNI